MCEVLNACSLKETNDCEHICTQSYETYICSCNLGYQLKGKIIYVLCIIVLIFLSFMCLVFLSKVDNCNISTLDILVNLEKKCIFFFVFFSHQHSWIDSNIFLRVSLKALLPKWCLKSTKEYLFGEILFQDFFSWLWCFSTHSGWIFSLFAFTHCLSHWSSIQPSVRKMVKMIINTKNPWSLYSFGKITIFDTYVI